MRLNAPFVVLVSLACAWAVTASAGDDRPAVGSRVRVTASGLAGGRVVGDLIAIEAAEVTLRRAGSSEVLAIPRDDVTRLEVASTTRSHVGRSSGIGALVGLGIGVAVGYAAGDDCGAPNASFICISRGGAAVGLGVAGAGMGALLGLAFSPHETLWQPVDVAGLQVSLTPSAGPRGGPGLALSVTF
jgi:hypothetical protein